MHMVTIEAVVPKDHLVRKADAALDLSFAYEETAEFYNGHYGRPPIDSVVLVKNTLVGFLLNIPSERQIDERSHTDMAIKLYLGLDFLERVSNHSTISQMRQRKLKFRKVFRRLFQEVVPQCVEKGLASGRLVGTDSTHVKANASRSSGKLIEIEKETGLYWDRLDEYEKEVAEELARKTGIRHQERTRQVKKRNAGVTEG